jgi:hypothetical protein
MNSAHYYQILGLTENAGLREIKDAFRQKAKAFHPDVNKDEGAHEHFLDINEAYIFLTDMHSRNANPTVDRQAKDEYYRRWMEKERLKARMRAAQMAKMRFEEYRRSSIDRTASLLSHRLDFFLMFLGVFIIFAGGFGLYSQGLYLATEDNGEVLNIGGIVAEVIITIAGVLFILLSWSNIRAYRENAKSNDASAGP